MTHTPAQVAARAANMKLGNVDPSAGVVPWPREERCPRCSVSKGRKSQARPGLCTDCRDVLSPAERIAWRSAA